MGQGWDMAQLSITSSGQKMNKEKMKNEQNSAILQMSTAACIIQNEELTLPPRLPSSLVYRTSSSCKMSKALPSE